MILVKPSYEILRCPGSELLETIEQIGRVCYKSEDKITRDSAKAFCKRIIDRGHESVIEHEFMTIKFTVDRGVSHELVRHRLCSFNQESTRYCDYQKNKHVTFIIPPWVSIEPGTYSNGLQEVSIAGHSVGDLQWFRGCSNTEISYQNLRAVGWSAQQARSVLPNSLKTEVVMTANLREWRHVFDLRCSLKAHPQMQEVMIPLRDELKRDMPIVLGERE